MCVGVDHFGLIFLGFAMSPGSGCLFTSPDSTSVLAFISSNKFFPPSSLFWGPYHVNAIMPDDVVEIS